MYSLGIDIGSSSIKTALLNADTGEVVASAQKPNEEMRIITQKSGWAEQDPETWWVNVLECIKAIKETNKTELLQTKWIGIAYQMHGLVAINKQKEVVRSSIIWCDSRAVDTGKKAFLELGSSYCLNNLLNSPGNFTASKLKWVQDNEPMLYESINQFMLPGDFISMKLCGEVNTTISGMSEGILWDFKANHISKKLIEHFGISEDLLPDYHPSFHTHAKILPEIAEQIGVSIEAKITYKAGDQPNNALSLNVLEAGEIAATAGTSGVIYAVTDQLFVDENQRVNSFAHVNHTADENRIGVLLCINGVGIANSFLKKFTKIDTYDEMNQLASTIQPGAEGLQILPFGNGAERMLQNKDIGASIHHVNYNVHKDAHFCRAFQEGIAYAFKYGVDCILENGLPIHTLKAGYANLFLSPVFTQILSDLLNLEIIIYDTNGATGAARGALLGAKYRTKEELFEKLTVVKRYSPNAEHHKEYIQLYNDWKNTLNQQLNSI